VLVGEWLNICDRNCRSDSSNPEVTDGYSKTAPVGNYPAGASWVGALDMAGNVWEWTSTIYDQAEYPYPYQQGDGREDSNPSESNVTRVIRGGSFNNQDARAASRSFLGAEARYPDNVGFRIVKEISPEATPVYATPRPDITQLPTATLPTRAEVEFSWEDRAVGDGWSDPEGELFPSYQWTTDEVATLYFELSRSADLRIVFDMIPITPEVGGSLLFFVNGQPVELEYEKTPEGAVRCTAIVAASDIQDRVIELRFQSDLESPRDLRGSEDSRMLGIAVDKLTIEPYIQK
jgi:hypothetical protein